MKRFVALMMCAVSLGAAAQFPNLPYNPDENGDGLIGVVDLQGLLANYGNEFASAVLSEDGESAIVYMGDMDYFSCDHSCGQLPGMWQLPAARDLVLVYDVLNASLNFTNTWVNRDDFVEALTNPNSFPFYQGRSIWTDRDILTNEPHAGYRCYCAAKQLPRVEYEFCAPFVGNVEGFRTCCQDLVSNGWYPLNVDPGSGTTRSNSTVLGQAFWRWAE